MTAPAATPSIWSSARRSDSVTSHEEVGATDSKSPSFVGDPDSAGPRSVFQQDYDRLLFSTPVRRLADKTQVWPMDDNDGVRTRLTHSHEVANLARSIGVRVIKSRSDLFRDEGKEVNSAEVVQPILLAIGLGHDLGNPPFGHQGEVAIGRWFKRRQDWIFTHGTKCGDPLPCPVPEDFRAEFTEFDGNPQTLRLVTKLQTHICGIGLDLSAATLAAGLKYPIHISNRDKSKPSKKKGGYFKSETDVIRWIREQTGLEEGQRHPLTWIMEACDDIAYSVLDVDDLVKKGMMSPDDVLVTLRLRQAKNATVCGLEQIFRRIECQNMASETQRDIKIQYLRALLIGALIDHASDQFRARADGIFEYSHEESLMSNSELCEELKQIAKNGAFRHPAVLRAEAEGVAALDYLMSAFWKAISDRGDKENLRSERLTPLARYVFSLVSPNYIDQAEKTNRSFPAESCLRYRELRLLTDMVSGMTDSYAVKLFSDIRSVPHADCP